MLNKICQSISDLYIDYENLETLEQKQKTELLFDYVEQTNQIELLEEWILQEFSSRFQNLSKGKLEEWPQPEIARLFVAISHFFEQHQVAHIYNELGFRFPPSAAKRDAIRELLLMSRRQGRISELKQLCAQIEPEFTWREFSIDFTSDGIVAPLSTEKLSELLVKELKEQDYRQLCFLLEIDYENIGAGFLLSKDEKNFSSSERGILKEAGVDFSLDKIDFQKSLRELWADQFIRYVKKQGKLEYAMQVVKYLAR